MMDDSELRRRFAQLRETDRENAPSFAQTYRHKRVRRISRVPMGIRPLMIGAAAAVIVVAVWIGRERLFSPALATPAIATWRAPTDILLDTPGSELLSAMPALGASVLDNMIPKHSQRGI
jgi:hypothetical protein